MKKFMIIFLFIFSSNCFATLITSDDVYDDGTYEWLHFEFTVNMTSADSLETFSGEGFRLATADEAKDLINDWFGTNLSLGSYEWSGIDPTLVDSFIVEFNTYGSYLAYGLVADVGVFGTDTMNIIFTGFMDSYYSSEGAASQYAGYIMVRDSSYSSSDVPEPSTLAILVFSLIGLASRRQYNKAYNSY